MSSINILSIQKHDILREYQRITQEYKSEEELRLHEIRQFAEDVVPRSRFIFDNYAAKEGSPKEDYFSYFEEHKAFKPEESFKNVRERVRRRWRR